MKLKEESISTQENFTITKIKKRTTFELSPDDITNIIVSYFNNMGFQKVSNENIVFSFKLKNNNELSFNGCNISYEEFN